MIYTPPHTHAHIYIYIYIYSIRLLCTHTHIYVHTHTSLSLSLCRWIATWRKATRRDRHEVTLSSACQGTIRCAAAMSVTTRTCLQKNVGSSCPFQKASAQPPYIPQLIYCSIHINLDAVCVTSVHFLDDVGQEKVPKSWFDARTHVLPRMTVTMAQACSPHVRWKNPFQDHPRTW